MAQQEYAYNYAQIDLTTGQCWGVCTQTDESTQPDMIPIPVDDPNYFLKYYNQANGQWYEDAAFTIPWQSSLI